VKRRKWGAMSVGVVVSSAHRAVGACVCVSPESKRICGVLFGGGNRVRRWTTMWFV
jgi:hypothetical protein